MKKEEIDKLRSYYHSLLGQQRVLESSGIQNDCLDGAAVQVLINEIERINADFPGFVPPFDVRQFYRCKSAGRDWFVLSGIRTYVSAVLGRLEVTTEVSEDTTITQIREFAFVKDTELRNILVRDYRELQRAYIAKCWKSALTLSGGAIEAMLVDRLQCDLNRALAASKAPKKADITKWDLSDLINVAVELKYVSPAVEKLSQAVREYRNLVHPGNEIRNKLIFEAEEAKIALEVVHIVYRELAT